MLVYKFNMNHWFFKIMCGCSIIMMLICLVTIYIHTYWVIQWHLSLSQIVVPAVINLILFFALIVGYARYFDMFKTASVIFHEDRLEYTDKYQSIITRYSTIHKVRVSKIRPRACIINYSSGKLYLNTDCLERKDFLEELEKRVGVPITNLNILDL